MRIAFAPRTLDAGTERGKNLIHDAQAFVETARWLRPAVLS
jgi:hypothetical protein